MEPSVYVVSDSVGLIKKSQNVRISGKPDYNKH